MIIPRNDSTIRKKISDLIHIPTNKTKNSVSVEQARIWLENQAKNVKMINDILTSDNKDYVK